MNNGKNVSNFISVFNEKSRIGNPGFLLKLPVFKNFHEFIRLASRKYDPECCSHEKLVPNNY